jgi:hypothetical protein
MMRDESVDELWIVPRPSRLMNMRAIPPQDLRSLIVFQYVSYRDCRAVLKGRSLGVGIAGLDAADIYSRIMAGSSFQ